MKIFGYPKEGYDKSQLLELNEVTIAAKPEELRKIAEFFEQAAIDIEKHGSDFEYEHLQDHFNGGQKGFDGNPDIIVYNEALL